MPLEMVELGNMKNYSNDALRSKQLMTKDTKSNTTVGIKTFNRPDTLALTLDALVGLPIAEVIVADDGEDTQESRDVYAKYGELLNLKVLRLPNDTGLSAGRNAIVDQTATAYLLMLDDDQVVPSNILDLEGVMDAQPDLGGISPVWHEFGKMRCNATNLKVVDQAVIRHSFGKIEPQEVSGIRIYYYDYIPNSTLFRTECLREFPWDNFYKIGSEHLDFYLTHKQSGKWKFAITEDMTIDHFPKMNIEYTTQYRHNKKRLLRSLDYFNKKWNLSTMVVGVSHYEPTNDVLKRTRKMNGRLLSMGLSPGIVLWTEKIYGKVVRKFVKREKEN